MAVEVLTNNEFINKISESERMPVEEKCFTVVPIFKNKGNVQSFYNYRGIEATA